jgi:hypothetical protein
MKTQHLTICLTIVALAAANQPALAQTAPRAKPARRAVKLAPAPTWDRAVLETFFTDARQKLGPGPAPGEAELPPDSNATSSPTAISTGPAASSDQATSGAKWSTVISSSTLEDEVKAQVQPLATAVQTPTGFKGGAYKAAREDFTLLAVLFGVIGQYDGQVRWQKEAGSLRDLFGRAGFNCKVGTDNSYSEAKLRSQDLSDLIRGNSPEARNANSDFTWPDVANRPPLMKRMERSLRERLAPWTAGKGDFTKNRDAIIHEAELLLVLARVIKAEGYEYADDSSYRGYVDALEQQCQEILSAARQGDLQRAQSATSQMNKTCDACHGDFRS